MAVHCRGEGDQAWQETSQLGKLELRQACFLFSAFLPPWGFYTTCFTSVCICRTPHIYLAALLFGCFLCVNILIFVAHIAYIAMPSALQSTHLPFLLTISVSSYLGSLQTKINYILTNVVCLPTPHSPRLAESRVCCSGCCLLNSCLWPPGPCGARGATSTRQVGRQGIHTKEEPHLTPACTRHCQGREKETHKKVQ